MLYLWINASIVAFSESHFLYFLSAILFAGLSRVVYANHVTRAHVKYDDKARFDDKFHAHVAQT